MLFLNVYEQSEEENIIKKFNDKISLNYIIKLYIKLYIKLNYHLPVIVINRAN